jgi:hypothetical protein
MRSRASHPRPHRTRISRSAPVTAGRRSDRSARQRSNRVPHAKIESRLPNLAIPERNRCGGQRLNPALESGMGEVAATPGQPAALARNLEHPPAIHPRESPDTAGFAAIIRQAQEISTFSLGTLSSSPLLSAIQKAPRLVQKLWTFPLPCGATRKNRN